MSATEVEKTEVIEALESATTDLLLIAHSDGRVTVRTKHDPFTTGSWLIELGQTMLDQGPSWLPEEGTVPVVPEPGSEPV